MIDKLAVSLSYLPPSAGAGPSGPYQDCTWNVSLSRSDTKGIWKSIQVHAELDVLQSFPASRRPKPELLLYNGGAFLTGTPEFLQIEIYLSLRRLAQSEMVPWYDLKS